MVRILVTTLFTLLVGFYAFSVHPYYGFGAEGTYYGLLRGIYNGTIHDVISWVTVVGVTFFLLFIGIFARMALKSLSL